MAVNCVQVPYQLSLRAFRTAAEPTTDRQCTSIVAFCDVLGQHASCCDASMCPDQCFSCATELLNCCQEGLKRHLWQEELLRSLPHLHGQFGFDALQ